MPALNSLRRYAYYVKQRNQFHGIDVAMEFFNTEREGYPDSGEYDKNGTPGNAILRGDEACGGYGGAGYARI